jgi:hypothetical protein
MFKKQLTYILAIMGIVLLLAAWLLAGLVEPARAAGQVQQTDREAALSAAVEWLVTTHQNDDGGYTSFSTGAGQADSDVGGTVDVLPALATVEADISASIGYLSENADGVAAYAAQNGGTAGKLVIALVAAGQDHQDFLGHNFAMSLTNHLSPTGQYNVNDPFNQSLAILGVAAAGEDVPTEATDWLIAKQSIEADLAGSWDDGFGTLGNPDATAMAIMALTRSGNEGTAEAVEAGLNFLDSVQLDSAGWEYAAGFGENANSTAVVLLALLTVGEDLATADSRWVIEGQTPLAALLSWQGESGAFQADFGSGRFDDFLSTVQALPALGAAEAVPTQISELSQEPTAEPEPTEAPAPTVSPAVSEADGEGSTSGLAEAGTRSAVPYILVVIALGLVAGLGVWVYTRRKG